MQYFIALLGGMLLNIAGSLVGRVLTALGMGVAAYTGINMMLDGLKSSSISAFQRLDPVALDLIGVLKVGEFISIVSGAVVARFVLNGIQQSGTFKKFVKK